MFSDIGMWRTRAPHLTLLHFRCVMRVLDNKAKYSILNGNEQLFASKYKLILPDEKELRREIERQKMIFQLQQSKD